MASHRDSYEHKENYYHLKTSVQTDLLNTKCSPLQKISERRVSIGGGIQLVETFMDICKKLDKPSQEYLGRVIPMDDQKEQLMATDQIILLSYLKQIVVYLIKTKMELEDQMYQSNQQQQYESCIQKLEADVRQHIRVEQQLRLFAETAQQKIEELQNEYNTTIESLKSQIDSKHQQYEQLSQELNQLKSHKELHQFNNHIQLRAQPKLITEPISQDGSKEHSYTHLLTDQSDPFKNSYEKQNTILTVQRRTSHQIKEERPFGQHGDHSPTRGNQYKQSKQFALQLEQQISSLINSPEKSQRKLSSQHYGGDTKAIKQPVIKQVPTQQVRPHQQQQSVVQQSLNYAYMGRMENILLSYRSSSQEPMMTYKKGKH